MKKLILTLVLLTAFSGTAQAQTQVQCGGIANAAGAIMRARQSGASIEQVMSIAGNNAIIKGVVSIAFKIPRYSSIENQRFVVSEFKNLTYLQCLGTTTSSQP